jgi:hypothetical protein
MRMDALSQMAQLYRVCVKEAGRPCPKTWKKYDRGCALVEIFAYEEGFYVSIKIDRVLLENDFFIFFLN